MVPVLTVLVVTAVLVLLLAPLSLSRRRGRLSVATTAVLAGRRGRRLSVTAATTILLGRGLVPSALLAAVLLLRRLVVASLLVVTVAVLTIRLVLSVVGLPVGLLGRRTRGRAVRLLVLLVLRLVLLAVRVVTAVRLLRLLIVRVVTAVRLLGTVVHATPGVLTALAEALLPRLMSAIGPSCHRSTHHLATSKVLAGVQNVGTRLISVVVANEQLTTCTLCCARTAWRPPSGRPAA